MELKLHLPSKSATVQFCWQHFLLLVSLYVMTFGVALCIRSNLGSSVISSLPMSFSLAGQEGKAWPLTIGEYTNVMNFILVGGQILILRRRFELIQLLQLVVGCVFGALIDLNMWLTSGIVGSTLASGILWQFLGCTVMGFGIAMEVRCGSVTMPGEGFPVALTRVSSWPFPKLKIVVDCSLVALAVGSCYLFQGKWLWNVIGPGTLFAMFYVGIVVKFLHSRMHWFDLLMGSGLGFSRRLYGLARFLRHRSDGMPESNDPDKEGL